MTAPRRRRSARSQHVSAYDDLGRALVAGLEVLHMCDRRAALRTLRLILPIQGAVDDVVRGLEAVGAIALARDLKEHKTK